MKTYIDIKRMQIHAHHGVLEQEKRVGNLFEVSVRISYDFTQAATTDALGLAINYAEAVDIVRQVMSEPRNLLETVAVHIHNALMLRWPKISSGCITVAKLHPPFSTPVGQTSVTIEW